MKKSLLLMMILFANISFAYTGNQEVISINSPDLQNSPKSRAINDIRNQIKEKYNLDIKVNAEKRYSEKNELDALQLGLTNMVIISSTSLVEKYELKDFDVFDIPFIFNGLNEFNKFNNSLVAEDFLREINQKDKNLYGLTFWAKNYKQIESNSKLNNYQDTKGKLYILPATEINKATSMVMNPNANSNIYLDDLKDKDNSKNFIYSTMLSLPDLEKYKFTYNKNILLTYHGLDIDAVLVNKRWFNKLSTDVQMGIIDIIKNEGLKEQEMMLAENQNYINNLKSKGVNIVQITPTDRNLFRKEMAPVHRYYYNYINKDLLVKIYNLFK